MRSARGGGEGRVLCAAAAAHGGADVAAIRPEVLARQPDLPDTLGHHRPDPAHDFVDRVRFQVAACVFGFAIGGLG